MNSKSKSTFKMGLIVLATVAVTAFICMIITFSASMLLENLFGKILVQTVDLIIFCSALYTMIWYEGDRDDFSVEYRDKKKDYAKGLKAGLIGAIVPVLVSLILVFSKLGVIPDLVFLYKILNSHFLVLINLVMPVAEAEVITWQQIVLVSLYQLLIPLMTAVSYLLGLKHYSVMEKLIYKNEPNPKRKKNRFFK